MGHASIRSFSGELMLIRMDVDDIILNLGGPRSSQLEEINRGVIRGDDLRSLVPESIFTRPNLQAFPFASCIPGHGLVEVSEPANTFCHKQPTFEIEVSS